MNDTEWPNFNSKEGLSIVLYSMSYCLLFHCFFFEHYLYYSTTWVFAFALSIFLACLIEAELFSNLHFPPTYGPFTVKEYDFQTQHKMLHLYSGHKTISFFWPFLPRERAASTMGSSY